MVRIGRVRVGGIPAPSLIGIAGVDADGCGFREGFRITGAVDPDDGADGEVVIDPLHIAHTHADTATSEPFQTYLNAPWAHMKQSLAFVLKALYSFALAECSPFLGHSCVHRPQKSLWVLGTVPSVPSGETDPHAGGLGPTV